MKNITVIIFFLLLFFLGFISYYIVRDQEIPYIPVSYQTSNIFNTGNSKAFNQSKLDSLGLVNWRLQEIKTKQNTISKIVPVTSGLESNKNYLYYNDKISAIVSEIWAKNKGLDVYGQTLELARQVARANPRIDIRLVNANRFFILDQSSPEASYIFIKIKDRAVAFEFLTSQNKRIEKLISQITEIKQ